MHGELRPDRGAEDWRGIQMCLRLHVWLAHPAATLSPPTHPPHTAMTRPTCVAQHDVEREGEGVHVARKNGLAAHKAHSLQRVRAGVPHSGMSDTSMSCVSSALSLVPAPHPPPRTTSQTHTAAPHLHVQDRARDAGAGGSGRGGVVQHDECVQHARLVRCRTHNATQALLFVEPAGTGGGTKWVCVCSPDRRPHSMHQKRAASSQPLLPSQTLPVLPPASAHLPSAMMSTSCCSEAPAVLAPARAAAVASMWSRLVMTSTMGRSLSVLSWSKRICGSSSSGRCVRLCWWDAGTG